MSAIAALLQEIFFPPGWEHTFMLHQPPHTYFLTPRIRQKRLWNYWPACEQCTLEMFEAHCRGDETIACASVNEKGMCRWVALDIDNHQHDPQIAEKNIGLAMDAWQKFSGAKLLEKSNDFGGFHVWFFLDKPITAHEGLEFARQLAPDMGVETRPANETPMYARPYSHSQVLRLPGFHLNYKTPSKIYRAGEWVDFRELNKEDIYGAICKILADA